jgi:DNA-binding MarR family transcriptional regulator
MTAIANPSWTLVGRVEDIPMLEGRTTSVDGRRIALTLTAQGEETLAAARAAIADHEQWLTSRFSAAELRQLTALLRRIHEAPQH